MFEVNENDFLHSMNSRQIIKKIWYKHQLHKNISFIMKLTCFISHGMKQFLF